MYVRKKENYSIAVDGKLFFEQINDTKRVGPTTFELNSYE